MVHLVSHKTEFDHETYLPETLTWKVIFSGIGLNLVEVII